MLQAQVKKLRRMAAEVKVLPSTLSVCGEGEWTSREVDHNHTVSAQPGDLNHIAPFVPFIALVNKPDFHCVAMVSVMR